MVESGSPIAQSDLEETETRRITARVVTPDPDAIFSPSFYGCAMNPKRVSQAPSASAAPIKVDESISNFIKSDSFWDELLTMQCEASSTESDPLRTLPMLDFNQEQQKQTADFIVGECAESISALAQSYLHIVDDSVFLGDLQIPKSKTTRLSAQLTKSAQHSEIIPDGEKEELLTLFDSSAEAMATLFKEQDKLVDSDVSSDTRNTHLLSGQEPTSLNVQFPEAVQKIGDFISQEDFWHELLQMQLETNAMDSMQAPDGIDDALMVESECLQEEEVGIEVPVAESPTEEADSSTPALEQTRSNRVPMSIEEALQCGTIHDDINVLCMKDTPVMVLGKPKHPSTSETEQATIELIDAEISARLQKGPDVQSAAYMFAIACVAITMTACSSSVYESPKLFRVLWAAAFAVNVVAVSIPGRLDRMYSSEGSHVKPWQSLFEPAGWAFAIWGAIYGLEMLLTLYVVLVGMPPLLFQQSMPYWLAGNWFQALWCFVFRAEFKRSLWVPMLCLALAAVAFAGAHWKFSQYMLQSQKLQQQQLTAGMQLLLTVLRLPLSLHSSWLVCGALLNLNSWIAISVGRASRGLQVTVAFASAFTAVFCGLVASVYSQDPCFAATAAWGLDAVSCRTLAKAKEPKGIASADVQESLGTLESMLSAGLKCVVAGMVLSHGWSLASQSC